MKLIVGLGNPGKEYSKTHHNVGFMILDYLANKYHVEFNRQKFNGVYTNVEIQNEKIILLKPLSYMNLSGEVIKRYLNYYKISIDDILIIQDDLDMDFGKIKIIKNSGSGGHNGIKNIENLVGTKDYIRLKIGISNNKEVDSISHVLGKINDEGLLILKDVQNKLDNIIEDFLNLDYQKLTNKYNNK